MKYFVDAWFLIALTDRLDTYHRHAQRLRRFVSGRTLVTHDAVLTEVLAFFSEEGPRLRAVAARVVRDALETLVVLPADRALFLRALSYYEGRPDKEYSLVDCMSMAVMREHGITHVLTNDHHFQQEGFVVVNDVA